MQRSNTRQPITSRTLFLVSAGIISLLLIGVGTFWVIQFFATQPGALTPNPPGPSRRQITPPTGTPISPSGPIGKEPEKRDAPETEITPREFAQPPRDSKMLLAAFNGDLDEVAKLLRADPSLINTRDAEQGATPLHWAVACKRNEVAKYLLEHGADISARGNIGKTPLHLATFVGNLEMTRVLLDNGAQVNVTDDGNATPLLMAVSRGHLEVAKLLLKKGADVDIQESSTGMSPLHCAIIKKNSELAQLLIANGANVNARMNDGLTPLAAANSPQQPELAELLKKAGATQ